MFNCIFMIIKLNQFKTTPFLFNNLGSCRAVVVAQLLEQKIPRQSVNIQSSTILIYCIKNKEKEVENCPILNN